MVTQAVERHTRVSAGIAVAIATLLGVSVTVAGALTLLTPLDTALSFNPEVMVIKTPADQAYTFGQMNFDYTPALKDRSLHDLRVMDAKLTLADGRPVDVFVVNEPTQLVIGAARGAVALMWFVSVKPIATGQEALVAFVNEKREMIRPSSSDVQVYALNDLRPLEWAFDGFMPTQKESIGVHVVLDASGSMGDVMASMQSEVAGFLEKIPSFAQCQLWAFTTEVRNLSGRMQPCADVSKSVYDIEATGGTDIYHALSQVFMKAERMPQSHQVAILVSDGLGESEVAREFVQEAKARAGIETIVLYIGYVDKSRLDGLMDIEIDANLEDVQGSINAYFEDMRNYVSGLSRLKITRQ